MAVYLPIGEVLLASGAATTIGPFPRRRDCRGLRRAFCRGKIRAETQPFAAHESDEVILLTVL